MINTVEDKISRLRKYAAWESPMGIPYDDFDLTSNQLKLGVNKYYTKDEMLLWANAFIDPDYKKKFSERGDNQEVFASWRDGVLDNLQDRLDAEKRNLFTLKNELKDTPMKGRMNPFKEQAEDDLVAPSAAYDYSKQENTNVRTVEIAWNGKSTRLNFTMPEESSAFSDESKKQFIEGADLSNSESRVKSLLDKYEELYEEMSDQYKLSKLGIYRVSFWGGKGRRSDEVRKKIPTQMSAVLTNTLRSRCCRLSATTL